MALTMVLAAAWHPLFLPVFYSGSFSFPKSSVSSSLSPNKFFVFLSQSELHLRTLTDTSGLQQFIEQKELIQFAANQ